MNRNGNLSVVGLVKAFGKKQAVRDVSFTMDVGEIVGLLGPNGAGKTTVFYIIVGFIKRTAGTIYLNGRDITSMPMFRRGSTGDHQGAPRARAGISYLPQEPSIFRKLTVQQNVWAILQTRKDLSRREKRKRLDYLLEELGIWHLKSQKAYLLSGGERRRTEIARALAIEPQFLLLDEPFAGIDPIAVYDIKQIVQDLSRKGIGVLLTDHNVRDTLEITHRSYIINLGEIVVSGSKEELLHSDVARRIYLGHAFQM